MPIPDFQTIMLPLLQYCNDGKEHTMSSTEDTLAQLFKLSIDEINEMLGSGRQGRFSNRVAWAKQYLTKAGLLRSPRRGVFEITPLGKDVLTQNPDRIDINYLEQFPGFKEFRARTSKGAANEDISGTGPTQSPREQLEEAYGHIKRTLQADLLEKLQSVEFSWKRFEAIVVDLLVKMGYGGTHKDAGKVTQPTKDGGVDGWIKEDKLGSFRCWRPRQQQRRSGI